jgi:hypothetical protein
MDKIVANRLAYIRYMYNFGIEQSSKVEPLFALSILIFHDAIETFCRLSMEYKGVDHNRKKELTFNDYWEILGLKKKETMKRFNKARVGLKHYGNLPSRIDMPDFIKFVTEFFEENTPNIFKIKFSEITLVSLVQNDIAREKLNQSENMLEQNNIEESLVNAALAFCFVMRDCNFEGIKGGHNLFSGIRDMNPDFRRYITKLQDWMDSVQENLRIISIGIDYRKYQKFRSLTPHISWTMDGNYRYYGGWWKQGQYPTLDDAKFCINFVIECALKLQQTDLDEFK